LPSVSDVTLLLLEFEFARSPLSMNATLLVSDFEFVLFPTSQMEFFVLLDFKFFLRPLLVIACLVLLDVEFPPPLAVYELPLVELSLAEVSDVLEVWAVSCVVSVDKVSVWLVVVLSFTVLVLLVSPVVSLTSVVVDVASSEIAAARGL